MTKIVLQPEPLTPEAFEVFGEVIECRGEPVMINEGTTERFHRLSDVELNGREASVGESSVGEPSEQSRAIINIFRAQPRQLPMPITMMERHPLGSQAFLPSDEEPYLVLVCEGEKAPDPKTLRLFVAKGQGVNYKANCWHHPLLALDVKGTGKLSNFWVVDRAGSGNNLEEMDFSKELEIEIPDLTL